MGTSILVVTRGGSTYSRRDPHVLSNILVRSWLGSRIGLPSQSLSILGFRASSGPTPVTPVALQMGSSSQPAVVAHRSSTQGQTGPGCHPDFTDADKLKARALELAFESMLRQAEVCEDVLMAIRLQEFHSRHLFAALDRSEEGFCDTCKEAFHFDPSLGLLTVWNTASLQRDTKIQIEAVHKAHGEPISMIGRR